MKKIDFKTRAQWGYFKSAVLGLAIGTLIAPGISDLIRRYDSAEADGMGIKEQIEETYASILNHFNTGDRVKVKINGDIVAIAKSEEAGREAYKSARLAYNSNGVKPLWVEADYQVVDKDNEVDKELLKEMKPLDEQELTDAILKSFDKYGDSNKKLAYTMRTNDYTVTVEHFEDIISALEDAQSTYDTDNEFQVGLKQPESRNVTMYEVEVNKKSENSQTTEPEDSGEVSIAPDNRVRMTAGDSDEGEATDETAGDEEPADNNEDAGNEEPAEGDGENGEVDGNTETTAAIAEAEASLGANDGVKYVGFTDKIQVVETYVNSAAVKDKNTAYSEITAPSDEEGIYVVERGDYLALISEKVGMTEDEIKQLNPSIESDEDIYYDDRLNIIVASAPVKIMVEKQETYTENYYEDIVYEDDDNMFIGETSVVQEGTPGTHTVTDLVTYSGDIESEREKLDEVVEVAAVAEIVKRGTKSKPTYMFPVTNWVVTSNFGYRWGRLHAGTDVGVPQGTTVRASRAGQVINAGWLGGYGNCVIIDHGDGVTTRYGHLSQVLVSVGQYVDQGEQVALSGNTGHSTGPHLHFEIRFNGEAVDPLPYLYN